MSCVETELLRIVLVEHDLDMQRRVGNLLRECLGTEGLALHCAADEREVLDAVRARPCDVCIVNTTTVPLARVHHALCSEGAHDQGRNLWVSEHVTGGDAERTETTMLFRAPVAERHGMRAVRSALEALHAASRETRSERQFRAVFEGALDAMLITNEQGRYVDGNPSALAMLGVDAPTLRSLHVSDVVVPGEDEDVQSQWARFHEEGHLEGEVVLRRADGALRTAEFRATANVLPGLHLSIIRDVTERRSADARLAIAERMASVGTMAAGVAHEINNPLTTVMTELELAESRLAARSPSTACRTDPDDSLTRVLAHVTGAREAATRIMRIVHDVKLFSHAGDERTGAVDLHEILASALRIASTELRHRARVVTKLGDIPSVVGNASRLGQVFLNLLVNAAQAIPEGRIAHNEVRVSAWLDDATQMVVVEIADTGVGMSRETTARAFTPFFTTKPPGVGLGVGLAICQRLVTAMGGHITASSKLGQGSAFRVALPVSGTASPPVETARVVPMAATTTRRARLLVIDDESSIGLAVATFFEREHDVIAVTRAQEALARIARGEHFDVIFCDLMMPHMTGMELHARLGAISSEAAARIVFWTGGAVTQQAQDFLAATANDCLQKPFTLRALKELVCEKLAGTPPPPP
ncbi:MAG: ATP-binding protein [Polyangiales bacterium]